MVGKSFAVTTYAYDDCGVVRAHIDVSPAGLSDNKYMAPPYSWNLTEITGKQTITVTVADSSGKTGVATVTVTAPSSIGDGSGGSTPPGGNNSNSQTGGCNLSTNGRTGEPFAILFLGMVLVYLARRTCG